MKIEAYKPLTIDKCREILGKEAEGISDVEIAEIMHSLFRKLEKLLQNDFVYLKRISRKTTYYHITIFLNEKISERLI